MRDKFRRILSVLCLLILGSGAAHAEDLLELQLGSRIRASYVEDQDGKTRIRQITGEFTELTDCNLGLRQSPTDPLRYVPRESITRLEKSIHPSSRAHAMTVGFVAGASLGAIFIIPSLGNRPEGEFDLRGLAFFLGAACILVGTAIGALVGLGLPGEKWQDVDLSSLSIGVQTESGQAGCLQLGFRF